MQIIASALLMGVVAFLGIVLYLVLVQHQGHAAEPEETLCTARRFGPEDQVSA
jgi:hypothetical protein